MPLHGVLTKSEERKCWIWFKRTNI